MLGYKAKIFKVHPLLTLDNLLPANNFYRQVEAKLDLSFVRELVKECYASGTGRPSIDPVTFFKLQLIMFFEGIRSERQLMETVNLNLAHRWYIGYDLDEPVPDHSSLSKIRTRYGLAVFQKFFEKIVERCIEAGLVWGKELYFDATQGQADASMDSLTARIQLHLAAQFDPETASSEDAATASEPLPAPQNFVKQYTGEHVAGRERPTAYRRVADTRVSTTDPDATPMKPGFAGYSRLGYHTHYVVDGGKSRIILAALVTPASVMDNTPMLDMARWVCFRWSLFPDIAVGDAKYGTIYNLVALENDGLRAYMPLHNQERQKNDTFYPASSFRYDAEHNHYICPQGHILRFKHPVNSLQIYIYRAKKRDCDVCPVQTHCRKGKYGRSISRSFFQVCLERVQGYQETKAYQKAMRKRQVWIEPLFGEGKQWHGMRRFRLRGLEKVNIEGLLRAAGQNIKRLLKGNTWKRPLKPAGSTALQPAFHWAFC